ncbi:MAG TPA: hypothetical protein VGC06_32535 [Actinomycetes bacterium]
MSTNEATQIDPIGLPAWRRAAIRRCVEIYDGHAMDPETIDGIVVVDHRASEADRAAALLELVEEIYPEAAARIRSHRKVGAKVLSTVCMVRLSEIALPGREFVPISNKEYAWRPKARDKANNKSRNSKAPARQQQAPKGNSSSGAKPQASQGSKAKTAQKTTAKASQKAPTGSRKAPQKAQQTSRASQASKTTRTNNRGNHKNKADITDAAIRKVIEQEEAKDREQSGRSTPAAKPTSKRRTTSRRTTKVAK